jgi:hypothetical protein
MTADPNGWPDASKPGVPKNPERSCTHRLAFPSGEHDWLWRAGLRPFWVTHTGRLVEPAELSSFRARYLGPCLTPAEVAAERAAAAEAMREACADYCHGRTSSRSYGSWADAFEAAERAIRALPLPAPDALSRALDQARAEVAAERDEMWNRIQRVQEHLSLPVDCTAQRIIEAIEDLRAGEREACASIEVRVTVPDGAGEWSPLEAWEEALLALNEAFRAAIRARGKGKETEG